MPLLAMHDRGRKREPRFPILNRDSAAKLGLKMAETLLSRSENSSVEDYEGSYSNYLFYLEPNFLLSRNIRQRG